MIAVLAGSLETMLLTSAASLLAAAKLRVVGRSKKPSFNADVKQSRINEFRRQLHAQHVTDIFSFACIATGMAFLGSLGGSVSLETIHATLLESYQPERLDLLVGDGSILGIAAIVLIFVGTAAAFGLFPMHGVVQNAFESSPAGIAGSTAVFQRLQAAVILWKTAVTSMPGFETTTQMMCIVFGTCACLAGSILTCRSQSLRSVTGNLWITWGGVVLVAAAAGMSVEAPTNIQTSWQLPNGLETAAFSLVISAAAIGLLLMSERWLSDTEHSIDFAEDVTGLGQQRGLVALAIACSLLTLSAIPPLPGFWCTTFVIGNAFIPKVESAKGAALVPTTSVLCSTIILLISLLIVAARSVHFLSLMFHHEPIRRFDIRDGNIPAAISLTVSGILIWVGFNVGTVLTWFHRLPL